MAGMRSTIAFYLNRAWKTNHNVLSLLLYPLSLVYNLIIVMRRWLYDKSWLKSFSVPAPVIVVGNMTVGGAGKTPLVIWLSEYLTAHGVKVGIIARGYGGRSDNWPLAVTGATSPAQAGDEAVMLHRRTGCPVAVSPLRLDAARALLAQHDIDVIISDDGLQHLALQRDMELVVVDAQNKFGNNRLLPAGPLRDRPDRLCPQALVIYANPGLSDVCGYYYTTRPLCFKKVNDPQVKCSVGAFDADCLNAVAGIGFPEKFFATLEALGYRILRHEFIDHYVFSAQDLMMDNDYPIVMTEKDAVKAREWAADRCWYLEISIRPEDAFVEKLNDRLRALGLINP